MIHKPPGPHENNFYGLEIKGLKFNLHFPQWEQVINKFDLDCVCN